MCFSNRSHEKILLLLFSKGEGFLTGFSFVQLWGWDICSEGLSFLRWRPGALAVVGSLSASWGRCFQHATCASFAALLGKMCSNCVSLGGCWHSSSEINPHSWREPGLGAEGEAVLWGPSLMVCGLSWFSTRLTKSVSCLGSRSFLSNTKFLALHSWPDCVGDWF